MMEGMFGTRHPQSQVPKHDRYPLHPNIQRFTGCSVRTVLMRMTFVTTGSKAVRDQRYQHEAHQQEDGDFGLVEEEHHSKRAPTSKGELKVLPSTSSI